MTHAHTVCTHTHTWIRAHTKGFVFVCTQIFIHTQRQTNSHIYSNQYFYASMIRAHKDNKIHKPETETCKHVYLACVLGKAPKVNIPKGVGGHLNNMTLALPRLSQKPLWIIGLLHMVVFWVATFTNALSVV